MCLTFLTISSFNGVLLENSLMSRMIAKFMIIARHTPAIIVPADAPAARYWNITPIKFGPHISGKASGNTKKTLFFKIFSLMRSLCQHAQSKKEIAMNMFVMKESSSANLPQHKTANGMLHKEISNAARKDNVMFLLTTSFFKC